LNPVSLIFKIRDFNGGEREQTLCLMGLTALYRHPKAVMEYEVRGVQSWNFDG